MPLPRPRKRRRLEILVYFLPVIIIIVLVLFALFTGATGDSGTLIVRAQSSASFTVQLHVRASVGQTTQTTPFNLTLAQGSYTVVFPAVQWYSAPPPKTVLLLRGLTQYAVGIYNPIVKVVSISTSGFNSSVVSALHTVTPVVWVNDGTEGTLLRIQSIGTVYLQPSENYTHVFSTPGNFLFSCDVSNSTGIAHIV